MASIAVGCEVGAASLRAALIGGRLDRIWVTSITVRLTYAVGVDRGLKFVDVDFSCEAALQSRPSVPVQESGDFFDRRAAFLSEVYRTLGREVSDISLDDEGSLTLHLGGESILLTVSDEDLYDEDAVWMVTVHALPASDIPDLVVSFVPGLDDGKVFVSRNF